MNDTSISLTNRTVAVVPNRGQAYPTTADEYTPLSVLGEGSFGKVYLMQLQRTGELVAVKKVPLEDPDHQDSLEEALSEINLLMQHNSRRLVKMHAAFVVRTSLWIVMEYLAGNSCSALLKAQTFTEAQAGAVCKALVEALDYVHTRAHQIHRDLKGANVLLAEDGRVCLGDFGVGAQLSHSLGLQHTQTGTPYWMAPEVITEQPYDARADVWSLGITAIELVKGSPPHSGFHPLQIIPLIPKAAPPRLDKSEDLSLYSFEFRDFVAQCLVKDPRKRPTAAQLRHHPFIHHAGLDVELLPPVISRYRTWKVETEGEESPRVPDMTTTLADLTQGPSWSFSTHTHVDPRAPPSLPPENDEVGSDSDDSSVDAEEELDQALAALRLGASDGPTDETIRPRTQLDLLRTILLQVEKQQDRQPNPSAAAALRRIRTGLESLATADPTIAHNLITDWSCTWNGLSVPNRLGAHSTPGSLKDQRNATRDQLYDRWIKDLKQSL